ncbi:MAG: hypothetical protein ACK4K9_02480 [Bacteroidia bacterium]
MSKILVKINLGNNCPNCGTWDLERIKRPAWSRIVFFFARTKAYWCRRCYTTVICFKKTGSED